MEDLPLRQVAGIEGVLAADPLDELLGRRDVLAGDVRGVVDQPQARLAMERDRPEPVALAAVVVGGEEGGEMPQGRPLRPQAAGLAVEVGDLLGVQQPVHPEERGTVLDRARAVELLPADQVAVPARGVDHPGGAAGDLAAVRREAESVRPLAGQFHVQAGDGMDQLEARVLQVPAQDLGLERVAVELEGGDVGDLPDVRLAEVLPDLAAPLRLPVEAEVVLEIVLLEQVLLQLEHPGVVVAAHLDRGLPHLLLGRWDLGPAVHHQDPHLRRLEQKLAGERQAGQTGAEDQDIGFTKIILFHFLLLPPFTNLRGLPE